jgi:hypothetical protein
MSIRQEKQMEFGYNCPARAACDCVGHLNYADRGIQSVRRGRKEGHSSDHYLA